MIRVVVNFLIRKSDSSTFPSPYLCVSNIYLYIWIPIYIYIYIQSFKLLWIWVTKNEHSSYWHCENICSSQILFEVLFFHSIPRWGKVGCRNLCERFLSAPESCFGKSIHLGYHSQSKPKGRNWCERGFKLVLFWESHAPPAIVVKFIYLFILLL